MADLTVVILTKNEEKNLRCCYGPNRKNTGRSDWEEYSKSHGIRRNGKNKIGRASCRERGWLMV